MNWKPALFALPLFLTGCVQSMFYYPDRVRYETPKALGLRYEAVQFQSGDGTRLSGWFIPAADRQSPKDAKGTVVHFHGNAQNMSSHWRFVAWLPAQDFNVFVFDYRGYGESEGKPEPKGVFEDSNAALDHVRSRPDVDPERLLLIHGTEDPVIPHSHSRRLLDAAREPKRLVEVAGAGHLEPMTERFGTTYQRALVEFFDASLRPRQP